MQTFHQISQQSQLSSLSLRLDINKQLKQLIYSPLNPITNLLNQRFNPIRIQLMDDQFYLNDEQYLKRYYEISQYANKIELLSQYYKYHKQLPKVYINQVHWIMEENYQAKRQLQYEIVTKQLNQQRSSFSNFEANSQMSQISSVMLDGLDISYNYHFTSKPKNIIEKDIINFQDVNHIDTQDQCSKNYEIIQDDIGGQNQNFLNKHSPKSQPQQEKKQKIIRKIILESKSVQKFLLDNLLSHQTSITTSQNWQPNIQNTNTVNRSKSQFHCASTSIKQTQIIQNQRQYQNIGKRLKNKLFQRHQQDFERNKNIHAIKTMETERNSHSVDKNNGMFWKLKSARQR